MQRLLMADAPFQRATHVRRSGWRRSISLEHGEQPAPYRARGLDCHSGLASYGCLLTDVRISTTSSDATGRTTATMVPQASEYARPAMH